MAWYERTYGKKAADKGMLDLSQRLDGIVHRTCQKCQYEVDSECTAYPPQLYGQRGPRCSRWQRKEKP